MDKGSLKSLMSLGQMRKQDPEPEPDILEADDIQHEAFDKYISAKVCLPRSGNMAIGTVKKRSKDEDGNLVGKSNANPLMDTAVYEVEFADGQTEAYTANIIAEHIYSQVDADGHNYTGLDEILDHRHDDTALFGDDAKYVKGGQRVNKMTTRGWELCVRWKNGETSWVKLKDLKDANPIETAEYAVNNGIDKQPAFVWWVKHTLKPRERLLKAMQKRYFRTTQKYGIELPKTVKRALEIDAETGTTFWRDALAKEMKNVGVAFNILEEGESVPPG